MNEVLSVSQSLQPNEKDDFLEGISIASKAILIVFLIILLAVLAMWISSVVFAGEQEECEDIKCVCSFEPTITVTSIPTDEPTPTPSASIEPSVTTIPTALTEPSTTPFHPSITPFHPSATPFNPTPTDEQLPTVCPGRTKGGICP